MVAAMRGMGQCVDGNGFRRGWRWLIREGERVERDPVCEDDDGVADIGRAVMDSPELD